MLLNVGHGVAMANSVSYVLEKVKNHALSHNEDGVAKYLVEYEIPIKGFRIHSANPVGRFNIEQLLTHYGYKKIN